MVKRTIAAYLPPIPYPLPLYGQDDYGSAMGDTDEQHVDRVRAVLGEDPSAVLQALHDGLKLPAMPPRVPREILNWRAKAILTQMGLIGKIEAMISAMEEPQRAIVSAAWSGNASLARQGATVLALAQALGMTEAEVDALFIAAAKIEI